MNKLDRAISNIPWEIFNFNFICFLLSDSHALNHDLKLIKQMTGTHTNYSAISYIILLTYRIPVMQSSKTNTLKLNFLSRSSLHKKENQKIVRKMCINYILHFICILFWFQLPFFFFSFHLLFPLFGDTFFLFVCSLPILFFSLASLALIFLLFFFNIIFDHIQFLAVWHWPHTYTHAFFFQLIALLKTKHD